VPPSIALEQRTQRAGALSTVSTVTEVSHYLRLLYARTGHPHCPNCGFPIERQTVQQIVDAVLAIPAGRRLMILAPVIKGRKGEYHKIFEDARKAGFVRVRVDGKVLGNERIRVPAGEFDTIKVRRFVYVGDWDGFRLETNIMETEWYAPVLGRPVRSESKSEYIDNSQCRRNGCPPIRGDWNVYELMSHTSASSAAPRPDSVSTAIR